MDSATDTTSRLRVSITNGPGAGEELLLAGGTSVLGRLGGCSLVLPDAAVSGRHASLRVDAAGEVWVEDLGSANGTAVEGLEVDGPVRVSPGAEIRVGDTRLELRSDAAPAHPPVRPPVPGGAVIRWPVPPPPGRRRWPAALLASVPVPLAGALYAATRSPATLLLGLVSFVVVVIVAGGGRHRHDVAAYERAVAGAAEELRAALRAESRERLAVAPDPARLADGARAGTTRTVARPMRVRLGLASVPSSVRLMVPGEADPPPPRTLLASPVVLDLAAVRSIGIAGPPATAGALGAWIAIQAIARSGIEVTDLAVISGGDAAAQRWAWARQLTSAAMEAASAGATHPTGELPGSPHAGRRTTLRVFDPCPAGGWPAPAPDDVTIYLSPSAGELPAGCAVVVAIAGRCSATLHRPGGDVPGITLDLVTPAWCARVARSLRGPGGA